MMMHNQLICLKFLIHHCPTIMLSYYESLVDNVNIKTFIAGHLNCVYPSNAKNF